MRSIALILIIVVVAGTFVQGTDPPSGPPGPPGAPSGPPGHTPKVCSREHCSGTGNFKRCGCGCHNCCVKQYDCKGGVCRRFFPKTKNCYCYTCQNLPGAASKKSKINKDSSRG